MVMKMDDLISRQAAIDLFYHIKCNLQMMDDTQTADKMINGLRLGENAIKMLNSAESQRKKGKWEVCDIPDYAGRPSGRKILHCPFCGYLTDEFRSKHDYNYRMAHFCTNCGAELTVGDDKSHPFADDVMMGE